MNQSPAEYLRKLQQELEEALKCGYILSDITTCLASGPPGSGKTQVRYLIFDELRPPTRISTACIEKAQRALLAPLVEGSKAKCEPVRAEELKTIVAEEVVSSTQNSQSSEQQGDQVPTVSEKVPSSPTITGQTVDPADSITVKEPMQFLPEKSPDQAPAVSHIPEKAPSPTGPTVDPADSVTGKEPTQLLPETLHILNLMKSCNPKQIKELHWVHFIDSGGQQEFLDILSALARNITLLLTIFKLSEKLSDFPKAVYYDENGEPVQLGPFTLTNEQLLFQIAQFAFYHQPSFPFLYTEATPDHPKVIVVGTFKDEENKEESIERKNELLRALLAPLEDKQVIIPRSEEEVIFPVNATLAGKENKDPVASELCLAIQRYGPRLRIKLPSRWYLLELEVRRLDRKMVTITRCWEIAQKLHFESVEALQAALLYLHEANLFFYDPEIFPDIVFVDPDAIVGVVTHLFKQCAHLHNRADSDVTKEEELRFRDQGLFNVGTLDSYVPPSDRDLISSEGILKLLQRRLIAARVFCEPIGSYYIMPCLLRPLEASAVTRPEYTAADPLLVTFPTGWAPSGLFCALLVELLSATSPLQWDIPTLYSSRVTKLRKNSLELLVSNNRGTVTLINTAKCYEIHPSSTFSPSLLSLVVQQIDSCLKDACLKFSYRITHRFAFRCKCGKEPTHPATVSISREDMECPKNSDEKMPLSLKQRVWFTQQEPPARNQATQTNPSAGKSNCFPPLRVLHL